MTSPDIEPLDVAHQTLATYAPHFTAEQHRFLNAVVHGTIPDHMDQSLFRGRTMPPVDVLAQETLHTAGFFTTITQHVAQRLAAYIGSGTVLDTMAGRGFFVKAMHEQGIHAFGVDNGSWEHEPSSFILPMDACDAVQYYGQEITHVFVGWAPLNNNIDKRLLTLIKHRFPHIVMIHVGESHGGCTGSSDFWKTLDSDVQWTVDDDNCGYVSLPLLHDDLCMIYRNDGT